MKNRKLQLFLYFLCLSGMGHAANQEADMFIEEVLKNASAFMQNIEDEKIGEQKCQRGDDAAFQDVDQPEPQFFAFLSTSMPEPSWIAFSHELEQINGSIILRGMPQNSVIEFAKFVKDLKQKGVNAPILIDPEAFKKYDIKSVPALVIDTGTSFDKVTGNIPIAVALRLFQDSGNTSIASKELLQTLEMVKGP